MRRLRKVPVHATDRKVRQGVPVELPDGGSVLRT